jgi:hypothetical protein
MQMVTIDPEVVKALEMAHRFQVDTNAWAALKPAETGWTRFPRTSTPQVS